VSIGRAIAGLVLVFGLYVLFKGFIKDVRESTPPPTQYIIQADSRVIPDETGLNVLNQNNFNWPKPKFYINGKYVYSFEKTVPQNSRVYLPFGEFKDEDGEVFPGNELFDDFDIRTATMAMRRKY